MKGEVIDHQVTFKLLNRAKEGKILFCGGTVGWSNRFGLEIL